MKSNKAGKLAEIFAQGLFKTKGYKIIARNYITGKGTGAGEVDFIATKPNLLVFVEVKQRKSLDDAAHAILPLQQKRIWNAAEAFIQKNPQYQDHSVRFDVILVCFPFKFAHIEDAWRL